MNILGQLESQGLEQLNVEGQGGQPLIAPDHMGGAHQVVIHGMGKMIGGDAVGFQKNVVNVVFGDGQLSLHQVIELKLVFNAAGGAEPEHPGVSGVQLSLDVLQGAIPPDGVLAVIAGVFLVGLLGFPHGGQFLFRTEAGICLALRNQLLGVDMVDVCPLTLAVRTVNAIVALHGGAFVKGNAVMLQGFDQHLHRTGNFPLGIGVLHPKEQHAAGLVGHPLGGQPLHQIAQMDKTGGGGGHPGDHSALRQLTGREALLHGLRGFVYVRKQKIG